MELKRRGCTLRTGVKPHVDIAVDPLDGTSLVAGGRNGAVSVIAIAESGALYDPGAAFYMVRRVEGGSRLKTRRWKHTWEGGRARQVCFQVYPRGAFLCLDTS
jgi:hypothetical protein